jgi:hypothetical protein
MYQYLLPGVTSSDVGYRSYWNMSWSDDFFFFYGVASKENISTMAVIAAVYVNNFEIGFVVIHAF